MWQRFRLIALTYFTRKLLLLFLACYALITLPFLFIADHRADQFALQFGMLVPKVMFLGYIAFFVGAHLKQQFANPRARLLPGFVGAHLRVVMLFFVMLLVWAVLPAWGAPGMSLLGMTAITLHVGALGLWLGCSPHPIGFALFIGTVIGPVVSAVGRGLLMEIATGAEPILALSLISAHVASLVLLMNHLVWLSEDDPDYTKVQPLNVWDLRAINQRALQRNMNVSGNWLLSASAWSAAARLERAIAIPAATPRQRIALFALGKSWPSSMLLNQLAIGAVSAVSVGVILVNDRFQLSASRDFAWTPKTVMWFSLFVAAWGQWWQLLLRWPRLGYESLRPVSRHEWVWENGVAIAKSVSLNYCAALCIQLLIMAVLLPDALNAPTLWQLLIWITACQVLIFGTLAWLTSYGSMMLLMMCIGMGFSLLMPLTLALMRGQLELDLPKIIGLSVGTAVLGVIVTRQAMKRWCRMELP